MLRSLHMSRSLHMAGLCPGGALCSPSPLPPPTSLRCTSQQEDDYDDEAETTDGVDNIDYADDEEDDDEDVGSEDRKAKLEVPHAPPSRPRLVAPRLVDRAAPAGTLRTGAAIHVCTPRLWQALKAKAKASAKEEM